jgi:hypothetical protein
MSRAMPHHSSGVSGGDSLEFHVPTFRKTPYRYQLSNSSRCAQSPSRQCEPIAAANGIGWRWWFGSRVRELNACLHHQNVEQP